MFFFFLFLFLFHPGDSYFFDLFARNREVLDKKPVSQQVQIHPIPIIVNNYPLEVSGEGVYIVDIPSFTPIFEKNTHTRMFPASTTKIVTALVAYDIFTPDQEITVGRVMKEGQVMGLVEDEKITVENLTYGILVHSANDAAYALADAYGYDKFIELMNKKAASLHMKNSHFRNPAGLDDMSQYSTPYDLALASRELLQNKSLSKVVGIKEIIISDVDFKVFHTLSNVNKLLGETQGIGGLKTGYTEKAGENLVSFYKNNNHQLLIVILKSEDRFNDTKNVVKWINDNLTYKEVSLSQ